MPTQKQRVQVTLEPEVFESIKRLANHRRCSMSSILSEMAIEARPTWDRISTLMEEAKRMDETRLKSLLDVLNDTEVRVARAYEDSVLQLDMMAVQVPKPPKRGRPRKAKA